jgi:hypothetical protein
VVGGSLLLVLLASFVAHAQVPGMPPAFDLSSLGLAPSADARWVTEATTAVRFADGTGVGPTLAVGDRVDLVVQDGDKARIRKDDHYGWVPATVLSAEAPPPAPGSAPQLGHEPALPPLLSQPLLAPQQAPAPAPASAPQ